MKLSRIDFERYVAGGTASDDGFFADRSAVRLEPDDDVMLRHPIQLGVLKDLAFELSGDSTPFGPSLDWSCCGFIVHRRSHTATGESVLGGRPPQPVVAGPYPVQHEDDARFRRSGTLYLFNVLVALEWTPDTAFMTQLEWGFRRASDFLFDVTDGFMAFGQVTFGGRELMDCADVQILASNRLHPRSWVAGFHDPEKYTPVRLGRGMWSRRNQTTIGWDEPEAYRALVHEWAHYALCLRDRYLRHDEHSLGQRRMIVPDCAIASSSIMATLEGTSELVPHGRDGGGRAGDWNKMRRRFSLLPERPPRISGPGALPLPLPVFQRVGSLKEDAPAPPELDRAFLRTPELKDEPDRCWAFALREGEQGAQQLLALGTLEARTSGDIPLHGTFPGDTLLALFQSRSRKLRLFASTIETSGSVDLQPAEPGTALVDVLPHVEDAGRGKPDAAFITVRVVSRQPPEQVHVFPLGGSTAAIDVGRPVREDWHSDRLRVPTLDGHILLRWDDGRIQIATFSQGGGPPTHGPVSGSPVTAGSSNGNVMIFFRDEQWNDPEEATSGRSNKKANRDYSDVKVITTQLPGIDPRLPGRYADATRGYVYSLAASTALPLELTPTLVMYYDASQIAEDARPSIYREVDGHWEELDVYPSPRCGYVAVPLDEVSASKLVEKDPDGPRVERYRLVWA